MLNTFDRDPLPKSINGWHQLSWEVREKIRYWFERKWVARLVQECNFDSDSDHLNSNSRTCDR